MLNSLTKSFASSKNTRKTGRLAYNIYGSFEEYQNMLAKSHFIVTVNKYERKKQEKADAIYKSAGTRT